MIQFKHQDSCGYKPKLLFFNKLTSIKTQF
nr:MAG TPA: hypothetical protein [Caudoviricetes sp.]